MEDDKGIGQKFSRLVEILDVLRGRGGCPWDREQTEKTIANYFLEEVYEAIDALQSSDYASLSEELGDVIMEVVFLTRIAKEKGHFAMAEVLDGINEKMIRRHPHVFGKKRLKGSTEVLEAWNEQKKSEKERESIFDGITKLSPALFTAFQVGARASSSGFDWPCAADAFQKVKEEVAELEKAIRGKQEKRIMDEIGDALFSLVNVSRHAGVNPEIALREANKKFIRRFRFIEEKLKRKGKKPDQVCLDELDRLWEESKKIQS
jgi:tetrapyrrole methylase family protein/MazG family protein